MKEIKQKRTITEFYSTYEALDGTIFTDKEECQKYDESALGVLNHKVNFLKVGKKNMNCWDLCCGCDDNKCFALKPESPEDKDTILQWYLGHKPYLLNDLHKDSVDRIAGKIQCALNEDDIIFFGLNDDNEPYIMNTRNNIINNLRNFDKDESEKM